MTDNPTQPRGSGQTSPLAMVAGRRDWRLELERNYQPLSRRLQDAYRRLTPGIERAIGTLSDEIQGMIERGEEFSPQALRDMTTYQQLLTRIQVEMRDFGAVVRQVGAEAQTQMLQLGLDSALDAVTAQVGNAQVLASVWMRPDPAALQNIVNYAESEAFTARMRAFGDNAAQSFADTMLGLTAQGQNPRAIARGMTQWLSIPYTWAENSTRTMQLYSYRFSNHAAYAANPRVVTGWMWRAALDLRTCMSCVRQHGSIHPTSEMLRDHHRGRCGPVPIVRGATWQYDVEGGEDWFNRQPASVQRRMMGPGMYSAWRRNEFAFSDLSRPYTDDVYGEMLRAATLGELTRRNDS